MGKRDRRFSEPRSGFTLGDMIPKTVGDRLRGTAPTQQIMPLKGQDPRVLAGRLLNGEIKVGELPAGMLGDVLAAMGPVHQAIIARNEETVRSLRDALKGSNEVSRSRDEVQASAQAEIDRHRRQAQDLGRTNLTLREQLDQLRVQMQIAQGERAKAQQQVLELEGQVRDLTAMQLGIAEGKLQRRFVDLVSTDLPAWLGRRDQLLSRARHYSTDLDNKVEEADGQRMELIAMIENAEEARLDRAFGADEAAWAKYLACCDQVGTHRKAFEQTLGEVERINERRRSCRDDYSAIEKEGQTLFHSITSLVHAFHLVGVDIWERAAVPSTVLERFELPTEVVLLMVQNIPVRLLDPDYQERMDALFSHVLKAPEPRVKKASLPEPSKPSAHVQFFPGSIFLVEPEREVERLTCLVLARAREAGARQALLPDEIAALLLRASLSNRSKRELASLVTKACQSLIGRGVLQRQLRQLPGMKNSAPAFRARNPECANEARLLLSQVSGGCAEQLNEKIARLFSGGHVEG